MKIPAALSDEEGAAFPEVFLTAFLNIFMLAEAKAGESVLVHGGGSGVGTASILLCKEAGVRSIVTAGNDAKCEQCLKLGAEVAINYNSGPFAGRGQERPPTDAAPTSSSTVSARPTWDRISRRSRIAGGWC